MRCAAQHYTDSLSGIAVLSRLPLPLDELVQYRQLLLWIVLRLHAGKASIKLTVSQQKKRRRNFLGTDGTKHRTRVFFTSTHIKWKNTAVQEPINLQQYGRSANCLRVKKCSPPMSPPESSIQCVCAVIIHLLQRRLHNHQPNKYVGWVISFPLN